MLDMIKIGAFIKRKRKEKGLTQSELAELFGITDRAVSKWERGLSLPDASIMMDLSDTLGITLNELLSGGEKETNTDEIILSLKAREEELSKILLLVERVMMAVSIALLLIITISASFFIEDPFWANALILIALIPILVMAGFALLIEQRAGYYKCSNCGHVYIPNFQSVFKAQHIGTKRKMTCPNCNKKCWHKKVIKK